MSLTSKLMNFFTLPQAAATPSSGGSGPLQPQELPKVKPNQQSFGGYVTSTTPGSAVLPQNDKNIANQDLVTTYRSGASTQEVVRNLVQVNPDLAGAVSAHLRLGIPEKYIALVYGPDGEFDLEAARLVEQLLRRWESAPDYSTGFSQTDSLRSVSEAVGKEGIMYGGMMLELVLDKQRLPSFLSPVTVTQIKWYEDGKGLRPVQVVGGVEVDLDFPTVFYVATDASLIDPYPQSPLESAIQPVLASQQFINDLRRVCQRHIYPRYDIAINEEKFRTTIPPEILNEPEQLEEFISRMYAQVEAMVNDLGPEEALVHFDFITVAHVKGADGDVPNTFETVKEIHDAKLATGAKSMPAILGHAAGSQNIASTETLLAMMTANSLVRLKLQELYSRALTVAARLFGHDVTVHFEFETIDLRPAAELAAFKAMQLAAIKEQLSLGMISDAEACLRITGKLPTSKMPELSGTMFMVGQAGTDTGTNAYSGTGAGGGQSGGGAANQSRAPKTPTKSKTA